MNPLEVLERTHEALADPSIIFDKQGVTAVNEAFRGIFALPAGLEFPCSLASFFDGMKASSAAQAVRAAIDGEAAVFFLGTLAGKRLSFTVRPFGGGKPSGAWALAEPSVLSSADKAADGAETVDSVRVLIGSYAHELNNALNAVQGFSALTARKVAVGDPFYEAVNVIYSGSQRASAIVGRLVDLGIRRRPVKAPAYLSEELKRIVEDTREGGSVKLQCEPGLAPINVDRDWLVRIVRAALSSAFSAELGTPVLLTLGIRQVEKDFEDHPAGLPAGKYQVLAFRIDRAFRSEELARAFSPVIEEKGRGWGVGVDLALARRMVQDHGGDAWAEEEEEGKSSLCFAFPNPT